MEFRKNSFNDSDSATLAKVATMFTNVADESMSAADSASFIIAQMKAFNIEADDAYRIIDSVNAVSNSFAVSSGDLANNLGNMSAAMATGNNTFEQSLGMLTAMTEITRSAAKGSRAMITVQGRLNQIVDESSDTGKKLSAWYAEHNIEVLDAQGQIRSLYEVLSDVADIWPKLTKNEQMYYLQQQAGTTQTQNLAALLQNYKTAIDATNTALESNGSAMKENEAYMESIAAKEQALASQFEDFANRVLSKELVGGFLDAGKAMLEFADTDVGAAITRITGFSAAIASLVGIAGTVIGKLSEMRTLFSATNAAGGLASILTSPKTLLIIAGVATAIGAVVEAVKAYRDYAESQRFDNLVKHFEELDEQAKDATDKLEDVKKRLDELNDTPVKDRGQDWQNEIDKLETLKQYYEYIAQMRQGQAVAAQEAAYNAPRTVGVDVSKKVVDTDEYSNNFQAYIERVGQYKTEQEAVYALAAKESISFTNEQTEALSKLSDETEIAAQGYAYLKQNLEAIGYTFSNNIQTASEYALSQGSAMKGLAVQIEETKKYSTELTQAQQEQYEAYIKNNQGQYEYLSGLSDLTTEQQTFVNGYEAMVDAMGDYSNRVQNTPDALQETVNTFSEYNEILANYQEAQNGVAGAADKFVQSLFDQNGQLTTTAQTALTTDSAMASYANSIIQAQQAQSNANFNNLIQQIALVGEQATITAGQIANMMAMAGVQIGAGGSTELARNLQRTYETKTGKKVSQDEAAYKQWLQETAYQTGQNQWKRQQEEYEQQLEALKDYVPTGTGGGGSSTKSAEEKAAEEAEKQAKKAQQAQEKAAKESQKAYESAAKSAEQAAQEAARAAEQAAEEAKQKILDSIQELKDASDDFWDERTDTIEESNKELDRQKQLEEKLKALEEARQKKILLYKNGQFQYDKDYGTIAKAQADYEETRDKIQREKELEQLKEMKENATEIFNEMKDIISNGGDVTQDMIDNWLSQIQADGANYYDSNKQLLSEWLDWAKDNISEFIQSTTEAIGSYTSTSSLMASGSYGNNASASDGGYLNDPKYYKNGEFVGMTVAWWMDVFEKQIKKGQFGNYKTTDAWLGNTPGSSVFDNWEEVLEYWAKQDGGDPYAMQDMLERFEAAQIILSQYKDIFESLGYDDLLEQAEKYTNLDVNKYYREAVLKGVVAHPEDPFGWRSFTPAYRGTRETTSSELWQLMDDIVTLDDFLRDYTGLEGNQWETAMGKAHLHADRQWHINMNDESDRYSYATFNTDELKAAYEENEDAIRNLSEAWFNATKDYEREAIHAQAELRREARDRMEELLGYEPSGRSEAERQANKDSTTTVLDKKKEQLAQKNTDQIKDYLADIKEGSNISQKYIDNAREYLGNLIEENSKKWFDLYDETEKDKLHEQTEYYRQLLEQLNQAEEVGNVTEGGMHPWEKELENADEWLAERVKEIEAQMAANSAAWWETTDEAERQRLHEENVRLAAELDELTGTQSTYEGSTGTWSWSSVPKNADGTHNFRGGLSLVGERGPEMRILGQGDNIIPANQTANLWKWSNTTPQAMLSTLSARNGGQSTSYAFDVSRIELPNVTDAKSFVQGLKNYALQYSYKR